MEEKIWFLKEINLLKCLSEDELRILGSQCFMRRYERGELVYIDISGQNIYFLKSGSVKVVTADASHEGHLSQVIEPGEIFGKFVEVEGCEMQRVVAIGHCIVCYLDYARWQNFIDQNPTLRQNFIKWLGQQIKKMEVRIDSIYFKSSRERIVEHLNDVIQRFGDKLDGGNFVVNLRLKHDEIAQLTGTSRQNVNTFLNELRADGHIEYDRNRLIIRPTYFGVFWP